MGITHCSGGDVAGSKDGIKKCMENSGTDLRSCYLGLHPTRNQVSPGSLCTTNASALAHPLQSLDLPSFSIPQLGVHLICLKGCHLWTVRRMAGCIPRSLLCHLGKRNWARLDCKEGNSEDGQGVKEAQ